MFIFNDKLKFIFMTNDVLSSAVSTVKNWWVLSIIGVLMIILSIWMFSDPGDSFEAITIYFSLFIFIAGFFVIFFSITNRDTLDGWGLYLAGGVLDIIVGYILLQYPGDAMILFSVFIGFWLLFKGIMTISASFTLQDNDVDGWGWSLFFGILIVIFALLSILYVPLMGGLYLTFMLALAFLFFGISLIYVSFKLKDVKNKAGDIKDAVKETVDNLKK